MDKGVVLKNLLSILRRFEPLWVAMFMLLMWLMYANYAVNTSDEVIFAIALIAVAAVKQLIQRQRHWDMPVSAIIFIGFIVYIGLLLTKTVLPQYSLDKLVQSISIFFIFIFINSQIVGKEEVRLWEGVFIRVILGLAVLEFLFVFVWYANWVGISGTFFSLPPTGYRLNAPILPGANFTSGLMTLILPLVLVRFMQGKNGKKILIGVSLFLIGAIEYYSSSRAGWIGAVVAIIVTLFVAYLPIIKGGLRPKKQRLFPGSFRAAIVRGILIILPILILVSVFMAQSENTLGHYGALSGRETIWSNAWKIWAGDFWIGRGSGSFPLFYSQLNGAVGNWLPDQAHNIWLQLGAETGLVGVMVWLATVVLFAIVGIKAWRRLSNESETRRQFAAYAGIGAGVLTQQLADSFFHIPLYTIYMLVLVVLASNLINLPRIRIPNIIVYPSLALLLFANIGGWIYASHGSDLIEKAYSNYIEDDSDNAASLVCQVANESPQFTIYSFQCGFLEADAFYADGDTAHLESSIQSIRNGLERDPYWPVHWANLGILEWARGNELAAISSMRKAAEAAPENDLIMLNYGWMAENLDQQDVAFTAYQKAIEIDPWLLESPFFYATPFRSEFLKDHSFEINSDDQMILEIYHSVQAGELFPAKESIATALTLDPANSELLALLGIIEQRSGESERALMHVETAVFLDRMKQEVDRLPRVYVWAAQVALAEEKTLRAANFIESAFLIWSQKWKYNTPEFYYYVYHRHQFFQDFVRGYQRADLTPEMRSAFVWLADYYYRTEGMSDEAREIDFWLMIESNNLERTISVSQRLHRYGYNGIYP
jgi:O-antigen ligase/Flp pilus assembly protein TadD